MGPISATAMGRISASPPRWIVIAFGHFLRASFRVVGHPTLGLEQFFNPGF
jgi:hypothetical protein